MFAPNHTTFAPGQIPTVRESNDNIPIGTRGVRVQIVNGNPEAKKRQLDVLLPIMELGKPMAG